jgi:flagellar motor protein MotB
MNMAKTFLIVALMLYGVMAQAQQDSTKKTPPPSKGDSIKAGGMNPFPPDPKNLGTSQARIKVLSDSLALLYQQFLSIQKEAKQNQQKLNNVSVNVKKSEEGIAQTQQANKTLRDSLNNIYKRHNTLRQEVNVGVKAIKDIKIKDLLDAKNRYTTSVRSIKTTANFIYAFNNGLNGLEASLVFSDYANAINSLNNPQNNELGFSLETEIVGLINNSIVGKLRRFRRRKKSRFLGVVSTILRNPITQSLVSSVPAVNSIYSVANLVNNTVVNHKGVSAGDLKVFHEGLRKYVEHYDNLSALNKVLLVTNENLKVKTQALRKLTSQFVKEMVSSLYNTQDMNTLKSKSLNDIIDSYYTYSQVMRHIEKIEKSYTSSRSGQLNYNIIVRDDRLGYSVIARNKIEFITREIEQISSEYLTALEEYHKNIVVILTNAYKLSKSPAKIKAKIKKLDQQFAQVKKDYLKKINIKNIKDRLNEIPRY